MNKDFIKKYLPEIISAVAGAVGGFIYWKYVGCLWAAFRHQIQLVPDGTVGSGAGVP